MRRTCLASFRLRLASELRVHDKLLHFGFVRVLDCQELFSS